MSLGTTISRLRAGKGLSQEELANALGVSRQSISKWETDSSVPELDKLVRLSDMFGVSLDQLVRQEGGGPEAGQGEEVPPAAPTAAPGRPYKTAGIVLLCMGFVVFLLFSLLGAGILGGLICGSPALICGLICLTVRRRAGLWCGWVVYLLADTYFRYAAGLNWRLIRFTLIYEPQWNYVRLAMAWAQFLGMILLVACTVFSFRKFRLELTGRKKTLFFCGWAVLICSSVVAALWLKETMMYAFLLTAWDDVRLALLTALLTAAFCARRTKREKT